MTKRRSHGEGTVLEWKAAYSPDTKYRARRNIVLPTGKKKEVYGYGRTAKIAVQDREARIKEAMQKAPSIKTMTVMQMMAKWLTHKSKQQRKRSTIRSYANLIKRYINPSLGTMQIAEVTPEHIQDLQYNLIDQGLYRTAQQVLMLNKCSFEYARKLYGKNIKIDNPAADIDRVPIPKVDNPKDQPWTLEEMNRFLARAKEIYDTGQSLYYPLFYTAFACGLRRGELLGLRWPEVLAKPDEFGEIRYSIKVITQRVHHTNDFYEDTPKTLASLREVPITAEHYAMLQEHRELIERFKSRGNWFDDNLVFPSASGHAIHPKNLLRSFKTIIAHLSLRVIKFHTLRKTYATYITQGLIAQDKFPPKVLQKLLGHARADVAMNVYAKVIEKDYLSATFTPTQAAEPLKAAKKSKKKKKSGKSKKGKKSKKPKKGHDLNEAILS